MKVALRTQQIIAEETGVTNSIDPLGGSYLVEEMTSKMERMAFEYIQKIDEQGGMINAIENGYPQNEIANAAYLYEQQVNSGEKTVVGVNKYKLDDEISIPIHKFDESVEDRQINDLKKLKESRDKEKIKYLLMNIRDSAVEERNLMPPIIDAVREYVTLGEICNVFRDTFGMYKDPAHF